MGSGVVTPRASGQVDFAVRNGGDVPMYDGFRAPSSGNYFWSSNGPTVRMLTARRWGQLSSPARKNADALFIEAPFAKADATLAAERAHLTTAAAGQIARDVAVRRVEPRLLHHQSRGSDPPLRL